MNESVNDEGDCRTAPATPGPLIIYCPYQDSTRDIWSNIPLCLQEFPWTSPLGTPSGGGVYLTVNPSSGPNTDRVSKIIINQKIIEMAPPRMRNHSLLHSTLLLDYTMQFVFEFTQYSCFKCVVLKETYWLSESHVT